MWIEQAKGLKKAIKYNKPRGKTPKEKFKGKEKRKRQINKNYKNQKRINEYFFQKKKNSSSKTKNFFFFRSCKFHWSSFPTHQRLDLIPILYKPILSSVTSSPFKIRGWTKKILDWEISSLWQIRMGPLAARLLLKILLPWDFSTKSQKDLSYLLPYFQYYKYNCSKFIIFFIGVLTQISRPLCLLSTRFF